MSKQYELKKWYPSLPKRAKNRKTIAEKHRIYSDRFALIIEGDYRRDISKEEVENNPEFWREIGKDDYEILSVTNSDGVIFDQPRHGMSLAKENVALYSNETGTWIDPYSLAKGESIHSVRRLSDGKVFTIGDRVRNPGDKKGFLVNRIAINGQPFLSNNATTFVWLNVAIKVAEPLFTTNDGKGIYPGDRYWYVMYDFSFGQTSAPHEYFGSKEIATFSSGKKAEEFVDRNKPKYSDKDIEKAWQKMIRKDGYHGTYTTFNKILKSK